MLKSEPCNEILGCPTPKAWIAKALEQQDLLLIDHAHCEKKAASSALNFIYRYPDKPQLLQKLSRLAREELRHFELVLALIAKRHYQFAHLPPGGYAQGLHKHARTHEPAKLIDTLIIAAVIEARSCERFAALIPYLDSELSAFYASLLQSEARHFKDYLTLAKGYGTDDYAERLQFFTQVEKDLILNPDGLFRFHSGIPI